MPAAAAAAVCRMLLQPPAGRGFPASCWPCCAVVVAVVAGRPRSDKEVSVKEVKSAELGWRCAQLFCCCRSARHYGAKECRCVRRHVRLLEPVGPWAPAELAVGACRTHRVQPAQSSDAKAWELCAPGRVAKVGLLSGVQNEPAEPCMSGRSHGFSCIQPASNAAAPCASIWLHMRIQSGGAAGTGNTVMYLCKCASAACWFVVLGLAWDTWDRPAEKAESRQSSELPRCHSVPTADGTAAAQAQVTWDAAICCSIALESLLATGEGEIVVCAGMICCTISSHQSAPQPRHLLHYTI